MLCRGDDRREEDRVHPRDWGGRGPSEAVGVRRLADGGRILNEPRNITTLDPARQQREPGFAQKNKNLKFGVESISIESEMLFNIPRVLCEAHEILEGAILEVNKGDLGIE